LLVAFITINEAVALENKNNYSNYGIYANGLLVESIGKRMFKELSGITEIKNESLP
jgi:hypothetical protein